MVTALLPPALLQLPNKPPQRMQTDNLLEKLHAKVAVVAVVAGVKVTPIRDNPAEAVAVRIWHTAA
jgi:hypothetical protein